MAYDSKKLANLQALKDTATRIKAEYLSAISKAGHARFQKADAVPEAAAAEENVLYLVKNAETQHYDIYALVDGVVELIDDTTVALDGYITEEELAQALEELGAGTIYAGTKTDLTTADSDVISAFFDERPPPKEGDVFIVTTLVDGVTYRCPLTGTMMASNGSLSPVMLTLIRSSCGTTSPWPVTTRRLATRPRIRMAQPSSPQRVCLLPTSDRHLQQAAQPAITAQPSISGFNLSGAKAVEAGTELESASYTAGTLTPALTSTARRPALLPQLEG